VLKNVDDKREIIDGLYTLLKHPKLYDSKKEQVKKLAENLKKGWRNEKEASYYINLF
jgi:transcription initiation factor IIE alpha subunit